jgi:hypothetical protein
MTQLQKVLNALTSAGACSAQRNAEAIAIVEQMMQAIQGAYKRITNGEVIEIIR